MLTIHNSYLNLPIQRKLLQHFRRQQLLSPLHQKSVADHKRFSSYEIEGQGVVLIILLYVSE